MNKIIIPILAIVFVSACIGGGQDQTATVTGKGLEITSFTADQPEIQSGRTIRISMYVENQGNEIIRDAKSLAFLIAPGDWEFSSSDESQKFGKDLTPADTVRGVPAGADQITWRLVTPVIPIGQTRTDEFEGRVYYDYETSVTGNAWLYSESEYDSVRNAGGQYSKAAFQPSQGPVKVEVSVSPDPTIVSTADNLFTLTIRITNVGGGVIYKAGSVSYATGKIGIDTANLGIVDVTVDSDFDIADGCEGKQELIRGQDLTVSCDMTASSSQIPAAKQSFPIRVFAEYGYYKSSKLTVDAQGR